MKILFLGDVVGNSGCKAINKNLKEIISKHSVDFTIVNGENSGSSGVGITEEIAKNFFSAGVDAITTGNHIWDEKEIMNFIDNESRLLRPLNLITNSPGNGFGIFLSKNKKKIGVLNLMGNIFMKKCEDVFVAADNFKKKYKLKKDYDFLIVDFHGEITSEKMAMGHFFDGEASLFVGTHTHVPTNDARILENGTGYQTDAGMCGDYNSVIGMNKNNSLNKFMKKESKKHFPAEGEATLCGTLVECDDETGLAIKIETFIFGRILKNY
jgi:metallophosphoesterase (TIGR00282 family)